MRIFQKILCPVDFSDYSVLALRYAAALANEYEADLVVYHSVPDFVQVLIYLDGNYGDTVSELLLSNATEKLNQFATGTVSAGSRTICKVGAGNPSEQILKVANEEAADLIVMGTHGHTGYDRFLLGSVTNRVLHKSVTPVLVVCNPSHHFIKQDPQRPVEIKRILCAVDLEPSSTRIRNLALSIARPYQSEISFLHVLANGAGADPDKKKRAQEQLRELINPEDEHWCKVAFLLDSGDPAEGILNAVEKQRIDLVIMGHHTRKPIEELFLGSVTKRVVPDCACPVLVVRSRADLAYPENQEQSTKPS